LTKTRPRRETATPVQRTSDSATITSSGTETFTAAGLEGGTATTAAAANGKHHENRFTGLPRADARYDPQNVMKGEKLYHTSRPRRRATCEVVAKAEHLTEPSNPRFAVTSLTTEQWGARALYDD
jgi:hypothetical protein